MEMIQDPIIDIHPNIMHLSQEQLEGVRDDFLLGELKTKDIMAKYGLSGFHPNSLRSRIPPAIDRSVSCPTCNVYSTRSPEGRGMPLAKPCCPKCGLVLLCDFDPDAKARELRLKKKESRLFNYCGRVVEVPYHKVEITQEMFSRLPFDQKVFLASIVACCVGEDLETVEGEEIEKKKICPTEQLFDQMVMSLVSSEVLTSNELWRTKIWVEKSLSEALLSPQDQFNSSEREQFELWKRIAYHEVAEYYARTMDGISLVNSIGQKGELTIRNLTDELSVSQIVFLIYTSARDACEFIVKERGSRIHASNTVLYNCLKKKDRYTQNGWNIKGFYRPSQQCPQSEMSSYLYDKVLRIGDKGFTLTPSLSLLEGVSK